LTTSLKATTGTARRRPPARNSRIPVFHAGESPDDVQAGLLASSLSDLLGVDDQQLRLVRIALSRHLGRLTGWRAGCGALSRAIAGIGHLDLLDRNGRTVPPPWIDVPLVGWPDTKSVMLRDLLVTPKDVDRAWATRLSLGGPNATLDDLWLVQIFRPPVWVAIAEVIEWGPAKFARYAEAYLRLLAVGEAPGRGRLLRDSLKPEHGHFRAFMTTLSGLSELEEFEQWATLPPAVNLKTIHAEKAPSGKNAPPELSEVRRTHFDLERRIVESYRTAKGRRRLLPLLRDRSLLELAVILATRAEPLTHWLRATDVYIDSDLGQPCVRLKQLKGNRFDEHIIPIPQAVYDHFNEYIEHAGIGDDDADHVLWQSEWAYFDPEGNRVSGTLGAEMLNKPGWDRRLPEQAATHHASCAKSRLSVLLSRNSTRKRTAHSARYFGRGLGRDAARRYLEAHPETSDEITSDVIVKSLQAHAFGTISDVYDRLNTPESKTRWSGVATAGIWELLVGDVGARLGLDEERVIAAITRRDEAQAEIRTARARIAETEAKLTAVETGAHSLQREADRLRQRRSSLHKQLVESLDRAQPHRSTHRRLELERARIDDELDDVRERLVLAERRLNADLRTDTARVAEADARVTLAEQDFTAACAARIPLPDDGSAYPEPEQRLQEILGRAAVPSEPDLVSPTPLRDKLSVAEYADAMGIPVSSLNRQIKSALESLDGFAFRGGASNSRQPFFQPIEEVIEVHGERTRFIVFTNLDLTRYHPDQIARMKTILAVPAAR
jgi:hypothetical protein